MREIRAVVLAAGKGARMKSELPKMIHELLGKPMVKFVIDACRDAGIEHIYVIVGSGSEQVKQALGRDYHYVLQEQQLGTGHALMQVRPLLKEYRGDLTVLVGDSPFITPRVIRNLIKKHQKSRAAATMITTVFEKPPAYGRIVRDNNGKVQKIVEEKDASQQIKAIREVNTSHYCFSAEYVLPLLDKITNDNAQKEYYLTDIIEILVNENLSVETLREDDNPIVLGINSIPELHRAVEILHKKM